MAEKNRGRENATLGDTSWNDRENARLRAAHGEAPLPGAIDEPRSPKLTEVDHAEIEEYNAEKTTRSWMGGPDSAQRAHQDKSQKTRSSSSRRKSKPLKRRANNWGSVECGSLAGDDYDGLTEQQCDYDLHPIYADFLERSGLLLRHMLLFLTYAHEYDRERAEWRETIREMKSLDRPRASGESGRPRKYATEARVARQERLPKGLAGILGVDIRKGSELSPVANMACAAYVWFLLKISRVDNHALQGDTDLERTMSITSSVEEFVRVATFLKEKNPVANLIDMVGAQTYHKSTTQNEANRIREASAAVFGEPLDHMSDATVVRSGFAALLRLVEAATEAARSQKPGTR